LDPVLAEITDRVRFSPATLVARIIAVGVDALLVSCAIWIALMLSSQRGVPQIHALVKDDPEALRHAILIGILAGAALPFLFALQVARQGSTPGKALMSLTVRTMATGTFPGFGRALGREALRFAHIGPLLIPSLLLGEVQVLVLALSVAVIFDTSRSRLSQTWYDRLMRTVIVAPIPERE
jgi:hypothetical protein